MVIDLPPVRDANLPIPCLSRKAKKGVAPLWSQRRLPASCLAGHFMLSFGGHQNRVTFPVSRRALPFLFVPGSSLPRTCVVRLSVLRLLHRHLWLLLLLSLLVSALHATRPRIRRVVSGVASVLLSAAVTARCTAIRLGRGSVRSVVDGLISGVEGADAAGVGLGVHATLVVAWWRTRAGAP